VEKKVRTRGSHFQLSMEKCYDDDDKCVQSNQFMARGTGTGAVENDGEPGVLHMEDTRMIDPTRAIMKGEEYNF
jgi:hypothetical protein